MIIFTLVETRVINLLCDVIYLILIFLLYILLQMFTQFLGWTSIIFFIPDQSQNLVTAYSKSDCFIYLIRSLAHFSTLPAIIFYSLIPSKSFCISRASAAVIPSPVLAISPLKLPCGVSENLSGLDIVCNIRTASFILTIPSQSASPASELIISIRSDSS